jgi:glycerol-3-phosphate O-acyltransferase / dihydroxyacetone phosphate acyltransferase
VANHPSAFMDPMVVATSLDRSVHFLAAAEFFGTGIKSFLFRKLLNMIPVYRPNLPHGELKKNEDVFVKSIELLQRGGAILVFPEGSSVTENRIRKLKTGVARMVLRTVEETNGQLDVPIVPIGLNYTNPHQFQSDLFINIGEPISTQHLSNNKSNVAFLTDKIEKALIETVLHIQKEEHFSIVKKAEMILKRTSKHSSPTGSRHKNHDTLSRKQRLVQAIHTQSENQPEAIAALDRKLDTYFNKLNEQGVSDAVLSDMSLLVSVGELLRLIFTLPIFLFGYVVNIVPYLITLFYFRRLDLFEREGHVPKRSNVNPAFKGSVALAIGMVMFIVFYLAIGGVATWIFHNGWIGVGLLVISYLCGLFVMSYIRWFYQFIQKLKLRKLISDKREVFASLLLERKEIIKELDALLMQGK